MKNFSVGDVVVCVREPRTPYFKRGGLYTVGDAGECCERHECGRVPTINLIGVPAAASHYGEGCPPDCHGGWTSEAFRLAYRPDPEVERERHEEPVRRPVKAPVGANGANRRAAAE